MFSNFPFGPGSKEAAEHPAVPLDQREADAERARAQQEAYAGVVPEQQPTAAPTAIEHDRHDRPTRAGVLVARTYFDAYDPAQPGGGMRTVYGLVLDLTDDGEAVVAWLDQHVSEAVRVAELRSID